MLKWIGKAMICLSACAPCLSQQPQPKPQPPEQKPREQFSDSEFLTKANRTNLLEIALGELTRTQSTNAAVTAFGEKMILEHQKSDGELTALASRKAIKLPGKLTDADQKQVDDMKKLSGRDFDRKYAAAMVSGHSTTVELFRKASADARDADVRSFAVTSIPMLEHHLKDANELNEKIAPEKKDKDKPQPKPEKPAPEKPDKPKPPEEKPVKP